MNGEERFLFLGNHLALDFLNTRPVVDGETVEFLEDGGALAEWLGAAGLVSGEESRKLAGRWRGREIRDLLRFREALRKVVLDIEGGGGGPWTGFVEQLNRLLEAHPRVNQVVAEGTAGHGLRCVRRFAPRDPRDVFEAVADAAADLLTRTSGHGEATATRLRRCRNCVLHFLDTSKKGTRQWCSMSLCGNRAKVAAFADRKRQEAGSGRERSGSSQG